MPFPGRRSFGNHCHSRTKWSTATISFGNGGFYRTKLNLVKDILLEHRRMGNPIDAVLRKKAAEDHGEFGDDCRNKYATSMKHCGEGLADKSLRINHQTEIVGEFAEVRRKLYERSVNGRRADGGDRHAVVAHLVPERSAETLEISLCR